MYSYALPAADPSDAARRHTYVQTDRLTKNLWPEHQKLAVAARERQAFFSPVACSLCIISASFHHLLNKQLQCVSCTCMHCCAVICAAAGNTINSFWHQLSTQHETAVPGVVSHAIRSSHTKKSDVH